MMEDILCMVVCDDFKNTKSLPPDNKLEVSGFGAHSYLEGKMEGGCFSTRTIWWIGYASSREDAIDKCKKNWKKRK